MWSVMDSTFEVEEGEEEEGEEYEGRVEGGGG